MLENFIWQFDSATRRKAVKLAGITNFDSLKKDQILQNLTGKVGSEKFFDGKRIIAGLMGKIRIIEFIASRIFRVVCYRTITTESLVLNT